MKKIEDFTSTHKIWFHFINYMKRWYFREEEQFSLKGKIGKKYKVFDSTQMSGYGTIKKVERYQKKYGGIEIIHVDDNVHASSILVLIPHEKMGVTTIFIPQCSKENNISFLYPEHVQQLKKTLDKMKKTYNLKIVG